MKKWISLALALVLMAASAASAEGALVAYFSHAGENYNVGVIEEGNTAKLARVWSVECGVWSCGSNPSGICFD